MKFLVIVSVLPALVCTTVITAQAIGADWISLSCEPSMDAWQEDGRDWTSAGEAVLDPEKPSELVAKPGSGVLISSSHEDSLDSNLTSKQQFSDIEAHVEFMVPKGSNGGVKLQGLYEIQLFDSYGKNDPVADDCGGIYPRAELIPRYHLIDEGFPPLTNAAKPAGQWQTLDVEFQAPRFDSEGRKTDNARFLKVVLNDQVIHEDVELRWPTGHAWRTKEEVAEGPLYLQGDHGPIAYRNIRVRPIE